MKLLYILILLFASCATYKTDLGLTMSSGLANSPEYPVTLNGKDCVDSEGKFGMCIFSIKADEDIVVTHSERMYGYTLSVDCTKAANVNFTVNVLKDVGAYEYTLEHEDYQHLQMLFCTCQIFPDDRKETISAKYKFLINLVNPEYLPREIAYKNEEGIYFGKHALYVNSDLGITKKQPICEGCKSGFSESYLMRFNKL